MTTNNRPHRVIFGHGPRAALALHCTLAHAGAWRGLGTALADRFTVTAIDLPGHGKSPPWAGAGDLHDAYTAQAATCLTKPVDLIGHSFGATVALRLAIEHPDLVRSLTLIEPVLFAAARLDAPDEVAAHLVEAQPYMDALEAGDMTLAARLFNRLWGDGTRWDDIRASAREYMSDRMFLVPLQSRAIFEDSAQLLSPERIARASMPSLLVSGNDSPTVAHAINAALARRLPDARELTVDGAGHMVPLTHPEVVAEAIRGLVEVA